MLRWSDLNHPFVDHGLSIDDVSITFTGAGGTATISSATTAASGTYTATVIDANGCTATGTTAAIVGISGAITSANTAICNGQSTNITGTVSNIAAGNAWSLTLSSGNTVTGTGPGTFTQASSPGSTTTYTITSLSNTTAACSAGASNRTGSAVVTVNARPALASSVQVNDPCQLNAGSIVLTPSGGLSPYTLTWPQAGGSPASPITGVTGAQAITALRGGTSYQFTATDAAGCTNP